MSFESSLALLVLGALNETQEVCRTKGFACFYVDTLPASLVPARVFPPG